MQNFKTVDAVALKISAACQILPRRNCMPERISDDWRQTAEAARDEQDPTKFMQLVNQLNQELKERAGNLASKPDESQE